MSDKKLIAVCGATGAQGGSVMNYLLSSGKYRVRGLTRNPTTSKCLQLKTKWGAELEWWKCDMNYSDEVIKAFEGCYGAFCLTDFWSDPERMVTEEFNIGRILIDSAVEAKIQRCIFSSLPNVETQTEGKLTVPHITNKARVEEYALTEFQGRDITTEFAFVWAGCYLQNFMMFPAMGLHINKDGLLENAPLNLDASTRVPWINMEEFGGFVLAQFENWEAFKGKHALAFNGYATAPQLLDWIAEGLGTKSKYNQISSDEFYQLTQSVELTHMFRYFNEYSLFPKDQIPTKYFKDLKNIEQATKSLEWKGFVKTGITSQITTKIGEVTEYVGEKLGAVKDVIIDTAQQVRENLTSRQAE